MPSVLASGLDHPEAVAWDPAGHLVAGGEAGQVYRVSLDGTVEAYADTGGFCLGIALDGVGNAYICDATTSSVLKVTRSGHVTVYCDRTDRGPLRGPNFPVFDESGRLWVSTPERWDSVTGEIVVIEPGGAAGVASDLAGNFPNGLAFSEDGGWLYVVQSSLPGVVRLPVGDGTLGTPELVVRTPGAVPDGLAVDRCGTLFIACYRPDAILRWDGHQLTTHFSDPQAMMVAAPANLAYFGADLERLVVSNLHGHTLVELPAEEPGIALHYPIIA